MLIILLLISICYADTMSGTIHYSSKDYDCCVANNEHSTKHCKICCSNYGFGSSYSCCYYKTTIPYEAICKCVSFAKDCTI